MKKCKLCNSTEIKIYPNKLCQICLSKNAEEILISRGKELMFTSEYLFKQYLLEGKAITQIANETNTSAFVVRKHLDWFLIPIRSAYEQNRVRIDENIFKKLNPITAYLLGYIFTDGDLVYETKKDSYYLRIYSKHRSRIETVKEILNTSAKIQSRKAKIYKGIVQSEMFWISIGTPEVINDLIAHGMVVKKNQEIKFPKLKKSLIPHFIRGCWTGSGCVRYTGNTFVSSITIGSLDFIKEIERNLQLQGLTPRNIHSISSSKKSSYLIKYATKDSEKLYKYLYPEKTIVTGCSRQKNKFIEFFDH